MDWLEERCAAAPPSKVYCSLLKACRKHKCLIHATRIRAHLAKHEVEIDVCLGEDLVITLVKCGDLEAALDAFYQLPCRTAFSWTAVISGLVDKGRASDALTMYAYMQEEGVEPDHYTFVILLKACGSVSDLVQGRNLHAEARSKGLILDVFVGTTLISMYGKCGAIMEAESVFIELLSRNIVTWNALLSAYVEQGQPDKALHLYWQMEKEGIVPNPQTFLIALQACGILADKEDSKLEEENKVIALEIGRALHAVARKKGFTLDVYIGNMLVSLYGKCNSIAEGENVFACFSQCNVVSWTALISMYVQQDQGEKALQSYQQMQEESVSPNQQTVVSALQACCILVEEGGGVFQRQMMSLEIGRALHADVGKQFDVLDAFVGTALVGMYAKCRAMVEAENVFSLLSLCTIVQWNGMLSAYVEHGQGGKALQSYRQLREEGICPNQGTFVITLQACCILLEEKQEASNVAEEHRNKIRVHEIGQALHADARKAGFGSDIIVGTTLVSMYGKCGTIAEAETVFFGLSRHNTIAWNAMLSAYVDQVQGEKALYLYEYFQNNHVVPNHITLMCYLQACSESGCMEICRKLHFLIISAGHDSGDFLASTLIDAYGSCASMVDARAVFDGLTRPCIAAWNACLAGYAGEGDSMSTLQLFGEMQLTCNEPSGTTFTSLLSNCSHTGLVEKGIEIFESIRMIFDMRPGVKHYVSMIDLLGRSGNLSMAEKILDRIPARCNLSIWLCLLGACRAHSNVKLGKVAFDHAVSLQPKEAAPYVLMSNIYGSGLGNSVKE